jgi:uncharacterized hydrophobic protein (TIGR00271 family)
MPLVNRALLVAPESAEALVAPVAAFAAAQGIALLRATTEEFLQPSAASLHGCSHVVALVDDTTLAPLLQRVRNENVSLGILPLDAHSNLYDWFSVPRTADEAVALAFDDSAQAIDILRCNDELALGSVMLGETPFLSTGHRIYRERTSSWLRALRYTLTLLLFSIRNLFAIHPFPVKLTTGKDKTIQTAITGLVAIENDVSNAAARLLNTTISVQDGMVSTILIAPKSVMEYLSFLFTALVWGEQKVSRLPTAISYIKSSSLKIDSPRALRYFVDGRRRLAESIELEIQQAAVRINLSPAYHARHEIQPDDKDTVKVENLPTNEARVAMIQRKLPLFTHALEEDFKDLFLHLRDSARAPAHFLLLMALSAIVATLGLFLSSAAVIIGAMVLSPLMAPIISLAMGILRGDRSLLYTSLTSIGIGTLLALATAAFIALVIPFEKITPEMAGRLNPNLLDLGIAIAAGIAGAYAHARESVMKSLPGVAIAVALAPPLCVAGIGLGWMDPHVISGALLLFLTNLVGIALAAALTFLVLGYAPILRAKRGIAISLLLLGLISIPLSVSFYDIYTYWNIERDAAATVFQIHGKQLHLKQLQVTIQRGKVLLRADVSARQPVDIDDLKALKQLLSERWGRDVELEVTPRLQL